MSEASDEQPAVCPMCIGGAPRMLAEDMDAGLVTLVTSCEVCEQTGLVSRRLARALWSHQEPSA